MAIVNTNEMLADARQKHYAVGAFNVENMEFVQAVIWAAQEMNSPVIVQTSVNTLKYATSEMFINMVRTCADTVKVPIAIHLDHGSTLFNIMSCVKAGYKSVMFDGSILPYEKNVEQTRLVVDLCKSIDVSVEAELGAISGKEGAPQESTSLYTDPDVAEDFVNRTGVDSLAVSIGTVHGLYKATPKLDYERLSSIKNRIEAPLVLHGASGLTVDHLRECIARGITKVNIATELRCAWSDAARKYMTENPTVFDPKKTSKLAREAVMKVVREKILLLGSNSKA
jgi:tagatose 1,6-diphosphate aldolase GatY/KbaY